jgi:hypothetical protein
MSDEKPQDIGLLLFLITHHSSRISEQEQVKGMEILS